MFHENEIIMFLFGLFVIRLISKNSQKIKRIESSGILIAGFYLLVAGCFCTIIEGVIWYRIFNFLEHLSYTCSSVLVLTWCYLVFGTGKETT